MKYSHKDGVVTHKTRNNIIFIVILYLSVVIVGVYGGRYINNCINQRVTEFKTQEGIK